MGRSRNGRWVLPCLLLALAAVFAAQGCSEKAGGTRYPNAPPDTHISKGPSETLPNHYRVRIFWYGTDDDGDVDHYDIALVRGLRRGQPVDLETLDWTSTGTNDSTFLVAADSCCYGDPDPEDPHYALAYWGLFVRAVDNERASDETPASIFFLASNEIPRVSISAPPEGQGEYQICTLPYFEWAGSDPDGDQTKLEYKYLALPYGMSRDLWGGGLPPLDREGGGEDNAAPDAGTWSRWVPADCTYVNDIDLSDYAVGSAGEDTVAFVVTVKDEAGAYLPEELFDTYNENRNTRRVLVDSRECSVPAWIESDRLGLATGLECTGRPESPPVIFEGSGIYARFYAIEDRLSSRLATAYRYYFDTPDNPNSSWTQWTAVGPLRDVGADPEWDAVWPAAGPRVVPEIGQHVFRVELTDRGGDTTCAELHFDVLEGPAGAESNILLVDDDRSRWWTASSIPDYEDQEFAMWSDILDGYDWQEWDTGYDFGQPVPAQLVGGATTVIWSVDEGAELAPDLFDLCTDRGNHLHSYVEAGGNLIVIGRSPVYCTMYWYDRTPDPGTRAGLTYVEFLPRELDDTRSFQHFMWDVFGIKAMQLAAAPQPDYVIGLEPGEGYGAWSQVPVRPKDDIPEWPGYFTGAFVASQLRPGDDVHPFYGIRYITNPSDPDSEWVERVDLNKVAGVYVEGDGERGWAAYIVLPAWWFEHDEIAAVIRSLLEMFGE
jgi:hypothetical protein